MGSAARVSQRRRSLFFFWAQSNTARIGAALLATSSLVASTHGRARSRAVGLSAPAALVAHKFTMAVRVGAWWSAASQLVASVIATHCPARVPFDPHRASWSPPVVGLPRPRPPHPWSPVDWRGLIWRR